jgi:hypothetical protein
LTGPGKAVFLWGDGDIQGTKGSKSGGDLHCRKEFNKVGVHARRRLVGAGKNLESSWLLSKIAKFRDKERRHRWSADAHLLAAKVGSSHG